MGGAPAGDAEPRYAELHCTSNFSFLEGASHPEELVRRAAALGYEALAITDRATLAGIVRAHGTARQEGIRLVVGASLEPVDAAPLVVWAADRSGYANLCRLLTLGHAQGADAEATPGAAAARCRLAFADVANHSDGLLAGVPLARLVKAGDHGADPVVAAVAHLRRWSEVFDDRLVALAEVALEGDDAERLAWFAHVAGRAGVPVAAAGDVRYHERGRLPLHDALAAVRHGATVDAIRGRLLANGERHLHDRRRIAERFAALPGALDRAAEVAARCTFALDELRYAYPDATVPPGASARDHLADLVWQGAHARYPAGVPEKVRRKSALIIQNLHEPGFAGA